MKRLFSVKQSIQKQLALSFVIPMLLVSLVIIGILYQFSNMIINNQVLTQFEKRLEENVSQLEKRVDFDVIQSAMNNKQDYERLHKTLNRFISNKDDIELAYVITKVDGKEVILALSGEEDYYLAENPFTPEQSAAYENGSLVMSDIYSDDWGVHKSVFKGLNNTDAVLGIDMDATFVKDIQNRVLMLSIGIVVAAVIVGIGVAVWIGRRFSKPIDTLVHHTQRLANGELDQPIETNRQDEFGMLTDSFEKMRLTFFDIVQRLRTNAKTIDQNSSSMLQASEELAESSQQISASTTEEAKASEDRSNHIDQVSNMIQDVAAAVSDVNDRLADIVSLSEKSQSLSQKGNEQVATINNQMKQIQTRGKETSEELRHLGEQSKEIADVVKIIKDISSQIDLLSLNASIEAARAGEAGRGFAVVAQEVQNLANQTDESLTNITENIQDVLSKTDKVIASNDESYQEILKGTELVEESGQLFEEISTSVEKVSEGTAVIKEKSNDMQSASNNVLSSVQQIAAISEESVATTEEVSASAEQQNASVQELKAMSEKLTAMAKELDDMMTHFKL